MRRCLGLHTIGQGTGPLLPRLAFLSLKLNCKMVERQRRRRRRGLGLLGLVAMGLGLAEAAAAQLDPPALHHSIRMNNSATPWEAPAGVADKCRAGQDAWVLAYAKWHALARLRPDAKYMVFVCYGETVVAGMWGRRWSLRWADPPVPRASPARYAWPAHAGARPFFARAPLFPCPYHITPNITSSQN